MKKILLLGIVIFVSMSLHAQRCGDYIDLLGIGILGKSTASIDIPDWENVDFILAEAVYKSLEEPGNISFSTGDPSDPVQTKTAEPIELGYSGIEPIYLSYVFRAEFEQPADQVNLDILENSEEFFSFAIYVYRKDGTVFTLKTGELVHVWHNGPAGHETAIEIPKSAVPRDIGIRFGITELNHDERIAIFTLKADGREKSKEIRTWNPDDDPSLVGAYIIEEITLENVPGDIDEISMNMLSKNSSTEEPRGGDSFFAGVVLTDLPCEEYESELLCSFTQGFYGNEGGKMCGRIGTSELLNMLLEDEDLVMGDPEGSGSFTIETGHADCVIELLPGGGPSKALSGHGDCENLGNIEVNKKGRIKNSLLAQGITLALNTRLSPDLPDFPVDGTEFVTLMAVDCLDPEAGGIPGTEKVYSFSPEVVDALMVTATDPKISDLLDLVNRALAGENISPLSLSQISDAATMVNEAFDECVVVMGNEETTPAEEAFGEASGEAGAEGEEDDKYGEQGGTKGATGVSENEAGILGIYPNPAVDFFNLSIPSSVDQIQHAAIYSLTGAKIMDIDQALMSGVNQIIEINVSELTKGIYFIRIQTEAGFVNERFGVQ